MQIPHPRWQREGSGINKTEKRKRERERGTEKKKKGRGNTLVRRISQLDDASTFLHISYPTIGDSLSHRRTRSLSGVASVNSCRASTIV